ncbi:transporter substrate-binding domain-containing protein [Tropicimonas sp.]|uniref:transporter substrate-binding domain-containing protein n=1 Tax=Tropicimonas sp. TaxID=2067044 RepID=UPI003A8746A3
MKSATKLALALGLAIAADAAGAKDWEKVTIATEGAFAPWNLTNPDGSLGGYEVDLYADLCTRMKVECTLVAQNWDGMIPGLLAGKYDAIMSGMSATEEREKVIAFSQSYGSTGQSFGVMKDGPLADLPHQGELFSLVTNPDGAKATVAELRPLLEGKVIGVQGSSIGARFIEENFGDIAEVREYKTTEQHDLDLQSGRIDVVMASPAYLMTTIKDNPDAGMIMVGPRFQGGMLGRGSAVGLRKEDGELKEMFDKALSEAKADGTTRKLAEKWFGFDVTVY